MAISLVLLTQLTGNGTTRTSRRTCTGTGNPRVSEAIPDSSTDKHVTCAIDKSVMTMIAIFSDKAITMTAMDASDQACSSEIAVGPDQAYTWNSASGIANPFSADVAYFHVTNASGAEAALSIDVLQDATP